MRPDRRRRLVLIARYAALAVVLGVAASVVMRLANGGVPIWYMIAFAAVLLCLVQLGRWTLQSGDTSAIPDYGPAPERPRTVTVLGPIERRLSNATRDRRLYTTRLRPELFAIARERVRRNGGPDLGELDDLARSQQARTVLGEELWEWLSDQISDGIPPDPHQVQRLVAAIESL